MSSQVAPFYNYSFNCRRVGSPNFFHRASVSQMRPHPFEMTTIDLPNWILSARLYPGALESFRLLCLVGLYPLLADWIVPRESAASSTITIIRLSYYHSHMRCLVTDVHVHSQLALELQNASYHVPHSAVTIHCEYKKLWVARWCNG